MKEAYNALHSLHYIFTQKDIIVKIEFEKWDHDFDDLLRVLREGLLKFAGIAHEHLTGSGLLLQPCCPDAKTLLKTETQHVSPPQRDFFKTGAKEL